MLINTPGAELGWQAYPFTLADPYRKEFSLENLMGEHGIVIAFISNHCPYVQGVIDRFVHDANILQSQGINVAAISSNDYNYMPLDSPDLMKEFAADHNFSFPYLVDEDQSVARAYGAVCTPDFFGFNAKRELQYRGRLDDAHMGSPKNRNEELLDTMLEIASTGKGPRIQIPSIGCSIKWK